MHTTYLPYCMRDKMEKNECNANNGCGDDAPLQQNSALPSPITRRDANDYTVLELYRYRRNGYMQYGNTKHWCEEVDAGSRKCSMAYYDILSTFLSIIMRAITVLINVRLAFDYCITGQRSYFIWTTTCIIVPMCITILIYANMCHQDGKFNKGICKAMKTFWLVFLSSFLFRYWKSFVYSVKCKRAELARDTASQLKYYKLTVREDSDVAFIRLFECFLEAAPQKILQISIVLRSFDRMTNLQIIAIISYFGSMAWCLAVYHRCNRYAQSDKHNMNSQGLILQLCWHFCISVSRTLCIAFVATIFPLWIIIACLVHAVFFGFVTFIVDRPKFAGTAFLNLLFCLILGIVYLFTYISVKDAPTRTKYILYYLCCSLENFACVTIFMLFASANLVSIAYLFYPLCVMTIAFYYIGIVFMVIYYLYFHPKITSRKSKHIMTHNRS